MTGARLQDLPVEVLMLLPEHISDRDGERDGDQDRGSNGDEEDFDEEENEDDDDDDDDIDGDSDDDFHDNFNEYADSEDDEGSESYNGKVSSRQHLIACLARVNCRFHDIFEPILYRTAVKTKNNAITTLAARAGRLETLKKAVEYGADLNLVTWVPFPQWSLGSDTGRRIRQDRNCPKDTSYGFCWATPLHMAASEGHLHVVKYLISIGVDLDVPGKLICDCLSVAEKIADFPPKDWDEWVVASPVWTALHYAVCRKKRPAARLLIAHGSSLNSTRYPIQNQIPRGNGIASLFGLDLAEPEKATETRKRLKRLIYSVERPKDPMIFDAWVDWVPEETELSVIHTAVAAKDATMIRHLIINCGLNINATDGSGGTALHYSLMTGTIDIVRYVLSLGADPNVCLYLSGRHPFVNAAGWTIFYQHHNSQKLTAEFLDQALQALLDSGVTCWVQRAPDEPDSHLKSLVLNEYDTHVFGSIMISPHNSFFKRFLEGGVSEYDPASCQDLMTEITGLFESIIFWYDRDNVVDLLDMIADIMGPIDFTAKLPNSTEESASRPKDEGESLGEYCFSALMKWRRSLQTMKAKTLTATLAKVDWLMQQGVKTTPDIWKYSAALVREQCRRGL